MADKNLNTRIKLKYDTITSWTSNNPVLLEGEVAIVEVPNNVDPIHNAPTLLMKVGDGSSTFTELGWVSGLATDVYPWAKQASKPSYTTNELNLPLVVADKPDLVAQGIIPNTGANRFAFLPSDQIILEQSKDAGQTWEAYPNQSDTIKGRLFLGTDISSVVTIPTKDGAKSCDCMLRISITGQKFNVPEGTPETNKFNYWNKDYILSSERYFNPNLYSIYLNSTGDSIQLTLEMYDGYGQLKSTQVYDKLQGYSGRNNLRGTASTFGGGITQLSNNWTYRFIFRTQCNDGSFDDSNLNQNNLTSTQAIYGIQSFSNSCYVSPNSMMRNNHIYDYDYLQNASFPGNIIPMTSETNYLGNSSRLWAGVFAKWGHFSNYVSENGTPLQDRYISFTLDSNNYPALCSRGTSSLTPYQYIRTGTVGILPYTLTDSGGEWTNAACRLGSSAYRFSESYISNMYCNKAQASTSLSAPQLIEDGTPLEDKYALKSELPSTKQIITAYTGLENIGFGSTSNTQTTKVITLNTTLQENDIVRVYFSGTGSYEDMNAGVITFEVAKGANNTKLMGSGSTFTATGGASGIIFVNVPTGKNQLICGTYALTDSVYAAASSCYVYKITIEREV